MATPEANEPNDDLRGDLARAFATVTDVTDLSGTETGEVASEVTETPDEPSAEQRARDEAGRFAKEEKKRETLKLKAAPVNEAAKAAGAAVTATVATPADAAAPTKVDVPAPLDWKGEEKLLWKNVPNALKQRYVDDLKAARAGAEVHQPVMAAIEPFRELFEREGGGHVAGGIKRLGELSDFAVRHPEDFVRTFVQQRGLDPAKIFGQGQPAQQGQAPQQQISPEFQSLRQRLDAFEARQSQQAHSATLAQIEAFASDPEHVYFNDVSDDMLAFIKDNPAIGLKGAYERAVWANPTVRAQLLAQQKAPDNQASVDAARRALSANLNGSPVPGASSQAGDPNEDLRTTLERNFRAASGGARV